MDDDTKQDDLIEVLVIRVRWKNGESKEAGDVTATISTCPQLFVWTDTWTWVILGAFSKGPKAEAILSPRLI